LHCESSASSSFDALELGFIHATELALPTIKCLLTNAVFTINVAHRCALCLLAKNFDHLNFCECRFFHNVLFLLNCLTLYFQTRQFSGELSCTR
jgi:hypothetical protein